MVYCSWKKHVFGLCPSSDISKTQRFGNWICFHPQVKIMAAPTLLGPLERASFSHWTSD
jgi:hypothetical protein